MEKIVLPKEEYIHANKNGKNIIICTLRQKVLHAIGLNSGHIKGMVNAIIGHLEIIFVERIRTWIYLSVQDIWSIRMIFIILIDKVSTGLENNLEYISLMKKIENVL